MNKKKWWEKDDLRLWDYKGSIEYNFNCPEYGEGSNTLDSSEVQELITYVKELESQRADPKIVLKEKAFYRSKSYGLLQYFDATLDGGEISFKFLKIESPCAYENQNFRHIKLKDIEKELS